MQWATWPISTHTNFNMNLYANSAVLSEQSAFANIFYNIYYFGTRAAKTLIRRRECIGWSGSKHSDTPSIGFKTYGTDTGSGTYGTGHVEQHGRTDKDNPNGCPLRGESIISLKIYTMWGKVVLTDVIVLASLSLVHKVEFKYRKKAKLW